jgi:uncharacterized protein YggU (UPF0235/DUF167 family)
MADFGIVVVPRASGERVGPLVDGVLRVRVTRPPVDGEANRAVIRLLADALEVSSSRLELVSGAAARRKRIRVAGMGDAELERRLAAIGGD